MSPLPLGSGQRTPLPDRGTPHMHMSLISSRHTVTEIAEEIPEGARCAPAGSLPTPDRHLPQPKPWNFDHDPYNLYNNCACR
jgi:hypothetical protein